VGYMRHHAIVVTSYGPNYINEARKEAITLGMTVTEIVESPINAYWSFMVCPDGSKEGWSDSDDGDFQRSAFVGYLRAQTFGDDSTPLDWVEVFYGDDEMEVGIVADADEDKREKAPR
jgi:hypothetical protein